ncbi:SDR family NAD(P)-dependent oxidoreductase [Tomitella cavernea]|uniref:SDR family NAD(P)-dependent oxidoreductase n=1 Tax=Tomitella cavernea TaxID=1387982 RepID=A0ABP9D4S1_9ACTN|nr:SDR family NAD(P)-dependent oxidoreductase [Tomitella cavernea]
MSTPELKFDVQKYGPWAVVAGGSEAVGAEFAHLIAKAGLNLLLIARREGPLEETAEAVRAHGTEVRTLSVDLVGPGAIEAIAAATADLEVGLLVVNAGANTYGHEFVTGDLAAFRKVLTLNIDRKLEITHLFGGPMRERGRGGIILLGSVTGFVGCTHMSVYSGAKAFSRIFTEGLWLEMREHDVDVLALTAGVTRTPAMERAGLQFDTPGLNVSDPADVAREGLEHLADGPVWIVEGHYGKAVERAGFPRDEQVLAEAAEVAQMMGR